MTTAQDPAAAAVYGFPPFGLVDPRGVQTSPFAPGSTPLEELADGSLQDFTVLAPPGTTERRYAVAHALRALQPGGRLTVLAPKDKGGSRLKGELQAFGCTIEETAKQHHRICHATRPEQPSGVDEAIVAGAPRLVEALGVWSQPGLFGWDRIDPGSRLLADNLPELVGEGADLGCGIGYLARAILRSARVERLALIDIDRRAVECCRRNVIDPRVELQWTDLRDDAAGLADLDFVVTNPPFHDAGREDQSLGAAFIGVAARALRPGGTLWIVANRHLPYEAPLRAAFERVEPKADQAGFKVYAATKRRGR
jgi:16S rRNA (guanine1207-N2)-methyltransferase